MIHCTAVKDRTRVLAALIHALVDCPAETIELDYALTRIGVEPFREPLLKTLLLQMGRNGEEVGLKQLGAVLGLEEMCSVRGPTILAFLEEMGRIFGDVGGNLGGIEAYVGVRGYLMKELDLSAGDLEEIQRRLAPAV